MTTQDMEKHFQREAKMQTWRIWTPVLAIISPLIVASLTFFMVRMINQFDQRNDLMIQRVDAIAKDQEAFKMDMIQKYSELRYRCCSEITSQN
jgi:large-conductance mechanosensitive channel